MKPANQSGNYSDRRRDDDMYDHDNGHRQPVGDELFRYNRRFSSDYANFDSAHAADYQRHTDFADEYNNLREGYYRNRGTQTGNSGQSEHPDAYGNRYGRDGEVNNATRYNEQRVGNPQYGNSGYGSREASGYGNSGPTQGGMASYGADANRYGSNSPYSNMGRSLSGSHRGKGPKSYVRSDDRIREDVSDRLRDDEHIDASDIEVSVTEAEVVLSGNVDSRFAKRHAEDLAESISGVRNVENRIRVRS